MQDARTIWKWAGAVFVASLLVGGSTVALAQEGEEGTSSSEGSAVEERDSEAASDSDRGETAEEPGPEESSDAEATGTEETSEPAATDTGEDEADVPGKWAATPGNLDLSVALGLSGLLYGTVEPGVDFSLIPFSEDVTLSLGGTASFGYCILCAGISGFSSEFSLSAWNFSPQGRALVHINSVGKDAGVPLDLYGGLSAGPNFYVISVTADTVTARSNTTTIMLAPMAGLRWFPAASGLFLMGEFRYQLEFGFTTNRIEQEEWGTVFEWNDTYARRGLEFVLGGGFRF